jgi:hypothetical protein
VVDCQARAQAQQVTAANLAEAAEVRAVTGLAQAGRLAQSAASLDYLAVVTVRRGVVFSYSGNDSREVSSV